MVEGCQGTLSKHDFGGFVVPNVSRDNFFNEEWWGGARFPLEGTGQRRICLGAATQILHESRNLDRQSDTSADGFTRDETRSAASGENC